MLLLAPLCKGSRIALNVGTATRSPTLKCMYAYTIHSTGHSPLLWFLTFSLNLRDSYIVKVKALANAFYVCAVHNPMHFHVISVWNRDKDTKRMKKEEEKREKMKKNV